MILSAEYSSLLLQLGSALLAGSLIGLERSFHGRPAGFRTHALVCIASALLMMVTTHQWQWLGSVPMDTIRTDPTRMAQGIMTGIGFLGAGVIFMEGLTVRGLTTAASIWITASLGILYGIGFYAAAIPGTIVALLVLALFRWIETRIPTQVHMKGSLCFAAGSVPEESELQEWLNKQGFHVADMNYLLREGAEIFEYRMVIRTNTRRQVRSLATALRDRKDLVGFSLHSVGN